MSVATTISQTPMNRNVEVVEVPDLDEVWVIPSMLTDLSRVRHLLPAAYADSPVSDFEPSAGPHGAWVLKVA